MYSKAGMCLFCNQLFNVSERETSDNSKQRSAVDSTEHITFERTQRKKAPAQVAVKPKDAASNKGARLLNLEASTPGGSLIMKAYSVATAGQAAPAKEQVAVVDLALDKPVSMSSVADGCHGENAPQRASVAFGDHHSIVVLRAAGRLAVNGTWKRANNASFCCRTFVEFEPWWEVDLLALYHIKYGPLGV
jgi:hypothetical protein